MAKAIHPNMKDVLLDQKLLKLTLLVKELNPDTRIEISFERYEDEDAHVRSYSPPGLSPDEVQQFELTIGQRCCDMLLETGPIIIGAVYD